MIGVTGVFVFDVYRDNKLFHAKKPLNSGEVLGFLQGLTASSDKVNFVFADVIMVRNCIFSNGTLKTGTFVIAEKVEFTTDPVHIPRIGTVLVATKQEWCSLHRVSLQGILEMAKVFSTLISHEDWESAAKDIFSKHAIKLLKKDVEMDD